LISGSRRFLSKSLSPEFVHQAFLLHPDKSIIIQTDMQTKMAQLRKYRGRSKLPESSLRAPMAGPTANARVALERLEMPSADPKSDGKTSA
jgi:hypothetical protein